MVKELHFVSSNEGKIREAEKNLGIPLHIAKLDLDEIQSLQLEDIVKHKAEQAYSMLHQPVIVDDVGLFVTAWNGFPGPFIKFVLKSGGNSLFLRMLGQETDRRVDITCTIGFHDGEQVHTFTGKLPGSISHEEKGTDGWGFDPIFIPGGSSQTFAQMGQEQKNKLSHRSLALQQLKEFLSKDGTTDWR